MLIVIVLGGMGIGVKVDFYFFLIIIFSSACEQGRGKMRGVPPAGAWRT